MGNAAVWAVLGGLVILIVVTIVVAARSTLRRERDRRTPQTNYIEGKLWQWRVVNGMGDILAESQGQGYTHESEAFNRAVIEANKMKGWH